MDEEPSKITEEIKEEVNGTKFLQESLARALEEGKNFKDKYFRSLAEIENVRKRLQQEKQESITYAIDNMWIEFLEPLDNFENALGYTENLAPEVKICVQGFKMIAEQFREVLARYDIRPYESVGLPFDPHFHEGIEIVETDQHEDGTVISEVVKGYRRGERILRVAKVKVAKRPTSA